MGTAISIRDELIMGKILNLLGFVIAVVNASRGQHNAFFDQRICPDGYLYAGEDTKKDDHELKGLAWEKEIARSPVYSCYKITNLYCRAAVGSQIAASHVPFNAAVD